MTGKLTGKVALITGTGGGQGREAALRFAAEGAIIAGCDFNAEAEAETAALVRKAGGKMSSRSADLADAAQAQAWIKDVVAEHGRIDIVYNNASAARFGSIPDFSVEDWQYTLRNELDLVFYVTKFAWPHLAVRGGVILNTASVAGHRRSGGGGNGGGVGGAAHSTTKAGIIALTRVMASEGAPLKIRANSISPGYIVTPGTAAMMENPAIREPLLKAIPLGRAGLPSDIITMALFLVSDDASYITGADMLVDGGLVNG